MNKNSNYRIVDMEIYYRKGVYDRFTKIARCSVSMTSRVDVTELYELSKKTNTKFYINFLYLISKVINSRDDYKMGYLYETNQVIVYDQINPAQYIFHEDTETCTPVYTEYFDDYKRFYEACEKDIENAKSSREFGFDAVNHPNWFDASYIPWLSYESLNVELPDGYLYYTPILNWGKFRKDGDRLTMPVSVRMNHAVADGYLISKVFLLLQEEMQKVGEVLGNHA